MVHEGRWGIIRAMTRRSEFFGLDGFGLSLHFAAIGRGSGFAGSAWRGLMGQALFRTVCSLPAPACSGCPALGACAYPMVFKPLLETALPPFWLHGWRRGREGWTVGVRWLGAQNTFAVGEWLAALADGADDMRFGGSPARLEYATIPESGTAVWRSGRGWLGTLAGLVLNDGSPPPATCRVRFVSPLVSKHTGEPLFGALHTRLQRLVRQHGDGSDLPRPAQPWRCGVREHKVIRIPLARRLLAGTEWDLELRQIDADAWRMLCAGSELHAGGQTGIGCGQYEILPLADA